MPGRHGNRVAPASAERRHSKITTEMAALGLPLPGSLVERRTRRQPPLPMPRRPSQPYGPYLTWTRKVENKTVTRTLNPEQAERLRPLLRNARRLRELVSELEVLALEHVENAHEAHT